MGTASSTKLLKRIGNFFLTEIAALLTSAGAADANAVPALDATGKLDTSFFPSSVPVGDRQLSGDRNVIINGKGHVDQKYEAVSFSTGVTGYDGPDLWYCVNSGAGGSFGQSRSSMSYGGKYLWAIKQIAGSAPTNLTGNNHWGGIRQRFEGRRLARFIGNTSVVSFIAHSKIAGTFSFAIRIGSSAVNSFVTTFTLAADTPTRIVIPIPQITTAFNIAFDNTFAGEMAWGFLNTGTYQTATLGAWQSGAYYTASGATNWAASSTNFLAITEAQWEIGDVATPFEEHTYEHTLHKCQHYYLVVPYTDVIEANGVTSALTVASAYSFVRAMNKTPSVSHNLTFVYGGSCSGASIAARSNLTWVLVFSASGSYNLQASAGRIIFDANV